MRNHAKAGVVLGIVVLSLPIGEPVRAGAPAAADSTKKAGGLHQSMTVEGEDRIQVQFERPALELDLDPRKVGGVDPVKLQDVIERSGVDLTTPIARRNTFYRTPYLARPWCDRFASGHVASFSPNVEGVARWQLTVADSRGQAVATFEGKGKPPAEIVWDGRTMQGDPAPPGFTYSYVFEAYDRAANKRNFVGQGFELPAYRFESGDSLFLLFPAAEFSAGESVSPVILGASSWLNQLPQGGRTVRVKVSARTFQQADTVAQAVVRALQPLLLGDPSRIQRLAEVQPGAPEAGIVSIVATR